MKNGGGCEIAPPRKTTLPQVNSGRPAAQQQQSQRTCTHQAQGRRFRCRCGNGDITNIPLISTATARLNAYIIPGKIERAAIAYTAAGRDIHSIHKKG